jgi:hypothetical protein
MPNLPPLHPDRDNAPPRPGDVQMDGWDELDGEREAMSPKDYVISRRAASRQLVGRIMLAIISIAAALIFAVIHAEEGSAATMQSGVVMQRVDTNSVDPLFVTNFLITAKWLGIAFGVGAVGLGSYVAGRRRPSVDTELAENKVRAEQFADSGEVELLKDQVKDLRSRTQALFHSVREISETLSRLREGQAGNTASITDIKTTVHSLKDDVSRDDMQRTTQMAALTQRIDHLINTLKPTK